MTQIKKILLPLADHDTAPDLLALGLSLAQRFDAHVEVLHVRADPRAVLPFASMGITSSMMRSMVEATELQTAESVGKVRAAFEEACQAAGVPMADQPSSSGSACSAAWREETGQESSMVALHGRLADLVILPRPGGSPPPPVVEAALRDTGRPLLVVPGRTRQCPAQRVALGWNGSAEAARAVAAALPLLSGASSVTVLMTEKRAKQRPDAKDLCSWLAWHGIEPSVQMLDTRDRSVGEALLAQARQLDTDLLVIGAYSHTRMREIIMSGVTGHALSHATIPVFMAH